VRAYAAGPARPVGRPAGAPLALPSRIRPCGQRIYADAGRSPGVPSARTAALPKALLSRARACASATLTLLPANLLKASRHFGSASAKATHRILSPRARARLPSEPPIIAITRRAHARTQRELADRASSRASELIHPSIHPNPIMARAFRAASPLPLPSSRSGAATAVTNGGGRGNFPWLTKKSSSKPAAPSGGSQESKGDEPEGANTTPAAAATGSVEQSPSPPSSSSRKRADALARLRAAFLAAITHRRRRRQLGSCVTGTIFGRRRGRVHVALQTDPRSAPVLLVEMAAYSTGALVREMSSGLVRLALECEKTPLAAGTYTHAHKCDAD